MKRTSRRPRKTVVLSDSTRRQLNTYALAASAAGVGILALAQPAEAKVVYTKADQIIGWNGIYALDLDHDGTFDFIISQWYVSSSRFGVSDLGLVAQPAIGNAIVGTSSQYQRRFPAALNRGARIGTGQHFLTTSGGPAPQMVSVSIRNSYTRGQWKNVSNRYLGLKFQISGKTHYGWARLTVELTNGITATLTGYAYETVPNRPILAGQTDAPDEAGSEAGIQTMSPLGVSASPLTSGGDDAGSLGRLALGAQASLTGRQP